MKDTAYFLLLSLQEYLVIIYQPSKDQRLSSAWNHLVVLNPRPLDWEFSTLTTKPLLQLRIQGF